MRAFPTEVLARLFDLLRAEGYDLIAPRIDQGAIVYGAVDSVADLPIGWTDRQAPGRYRLERREDAACFGYVVGPHSWKRYLFPPRETLYEAARGADGDLSFRAVVPRERPKAFIGVRACELAAMAIQDCVFTGGPRVEPRYAARRAASFVVAVNCLEPGGLCFCASMNTGPRATAHFDLALTEMPGLFLAEAGGDRGRHLLARLPTRPATEAEARALDEGVRRARATMGRAIDAQSLPALLFGNLGHPRLEQMAERCLACGNCTMVCPTCFCSTAEDLSDLSGATARRERLWDSCFTEDHAAVAGANFRPTVGLRYQQWFTHKLASWEAQFGASGCVGCGRCIAWCPVGIDITEEVNAIRAAPIGAVEGAWPKGLEPYPAPAAPPTGGSAATAAGGESAASREETLTPVPARVLAVIPETAGVVTLHVTAPATFAPRHGQFNMLTVPGVGEAAISIAGWDGEVIQHTVRAVGATSRALTGLRAGQGLGLRGPYGGSWPIEEGAGRAVTIVAGGLGLAPLRSAIRAMLGRPGDFPSVRLVYGARAPDDILYEHEMLTWAGHESLTLDITVDRAALSWPGHVGVVTRLLPRHSLPPDGLYLICGPEAMMKFTARDLLAAGVPPARVYLSMERNMKCAAGFCGRCQYGPYFICKDGPVFRYDRVAFLFGRHGF